MKKFLLSLVLLIALFSVVGCSVKKKENNNNGNKEPEEVKETVKVGTFSLSLTEKGSFYEMSYLYPEGTVVNSLGTYTILVYVKDKSTDAILFRVPISKFENKTIAAAVGNGFTKVEDKEMNGITWSIYKDSNNIHSYATMYNNTVYCVGFMSDEDMTSFENAFMNTVKFGK